MKVQKNSSGKVYLVNGKALIANEGSSATEPYIEETYDSSWNLTGVTLHGYSKIRDYAFYHCYYLESFDFTNITNEIGEYAFNGCNKLTSIDLSANRILSASFSNCSGLTSVTFRNTVTYLPGNDFRVTSMYSPVLSDCISLKNVAYYANVTGIPNSFCKNNVNLEYFLIFNSSVKSIFEDAFSNCRKLKYLQIVPMPYSPFNLPSQIEFIGDSAFYCCNSLEMTELPSSLTYVDNYAFYSCTGLTTLTFKSTPEFISGTAFSGCTNLTSINVPWSEGAVDNAPWGATNATITYDYTGE